MWLGYRDRNADISNPLATLLFTDNSKLENYKMLTQERLKELLNYDPNTGILTWISSGMGIKGKGAEAGALRDNGYRRICIDGHLLYSHRLAYLYMAGSWPENNIDHINHIRNDNRWINLRDATSEDNGKNASMSKNNKSGTTGVSWYKRDGNWQAMIRVKNKQLFLGRYDDIEQAIVARKNAEIKYGFHENHGLKHG